MKTLNKRNQSVERFVIGMTKVYQNSLFELIEKLKGNSSTGIKKLKTLHEAISVKPTKENRYEMFLETLKQIGRPAMTKEIAGRFKHIHPNTSFSRNKKVFMQQLYNSASYLSKEGLINRTPVGKGSFEYSLKPAAVAVAA